MYRISVCSNLAEISEISEAWRNIYRENKKLSPYQSYEWNRGLIEYRIYKGKLNFIVLYKNSKPVIIAPFIKKNRILYNELTFIGEKTHSDYLDFIYDKDLEFDDFKYLITEILRCYKVIKLSEINEKSLTLEFLNRLESLKTWYKQVCVKIPICIDEKEYLNTLSSNTRHTIKKEQNKIRKEVNEASFQFYVRENLEDTIVRQVVDLYYKRQKERYRKHLDEKYVQYLIQTIKESNDIFLGACFIHGDLAACQLSLISQENNICGMINAMNSAYKEYSLGNVLLYKTICYLIKENGNLNDGALKYKYYDLTRGNEEYKYKLGGVEHYNYCFTLCKNKIILYVDRIFRLVNKHKKRYKNLLFKALTLISGRG